MTLAPGAELDTPGGWSLALASISPESAGPPDLATCLVDADRVRGPFVVRNRRPGDRLRAHGLGGSTSLKRLFSSRHVPRHLRADHPIVVCDGEVLWVPGCGRSERGLVDSATTRCWVLRVIRSPSESA
jgi:tRNA(Ile)-lysidine synthase